MNIHGYKKQIEKLRQNKKKLTKKDKWLRIEKINRAIRLRREKIKELKKFKKPRLK